MRLVKLETRYGTRWVNPSHVVCVGERLMAPVPTAAVAKTTFVTLMSTDCAGESDELFIDGFVAEDVVRRLEGKDES